MSSLMYLSGDLPEAITGSLAAGTTGIESEIRFGARKEDSELAAHAWVECSGVPLNEPANVREQFRPFEGVAPAVRSR